MPAVASISAVATAFLWSLSDDDTKPAQVATRTRADRLPPRAHPRARRWPLDPGGAAGRCARRLHPRHRAKWQGAAFLLTLAFLLTFGVVRFITYSIHEQTHTVFHNVTTKGGLHIHHMVPGLVLTLAAGYLGLILPAPRPTPLLAIVFGIGAALVLDEFALILQLADVYWEPAGRENIDAVVLAGGIAIL